MNGWAARARKPNPSIIRRDQGGLSIKRMLPQALRTRSAFWLVLLLPTIVALASCGSRPEPPVAEPFEPVAVPQDQTRWDNQGAVEVSVVPLNMGASGSEQLDFQIAMNTHSVDLSMDLARLASLENDRGVKVQADGWSGGNGHHVSGILSFPLRDGQGLAVLEGASMLVLRIESVDAPLREFRWEVGQDR